MIEPGLDLHHWETRWQQLEDEAVHSPIETLPEMDRLIREMLTTRGFQLEEPVTAEGDDPESSGRYAADLDLQGGAGRKWLH